MLGSTLLSAATALFFLPAVFSAPVAPVTSVSSIAVPEVEKTTISTTRVVAIQKVNAVLNERKSQLQFTYDNLMATDSSKVDLAFITGICGQVSGILSETVTAVQSASTSPVELAAVDVDISGTANVVCQIFVLVFSILAHICKVVDIVALQVVPLIASVLAALIKVLHVVASLVPTILIVVGKVVCKVTGIVEIIKLLLAANVTGIHFLVAYLQLSM